MLAAGVKVTALFSPEHGINGTEDRPDIADSKDAATGLPVWSLYDNGRYRMTPEMLRDVDALVFDIQDAGARFYTYSCTMLYALEEAAKAKLPFYVLDRPNPDHWRARRRSAARRESAELRRLLCDAHPPRPDAGRIGRPWPTAERKVNADLHVIKMKDWQRGDWFDSTGLAWIDPSPNMRSLNAATLYDGVAMLEANREFFGGPGHGCALRTDRRGLDSRHGAGADS